MGPMRMFSPSLLWLLTSLAINTDKLLKRVLLMQMPSTQMKRSHKQQMLNMNLVHSHNNL